jgi:nicotinate-nucleotide adenylyltransferase
MANIGLYFGSFNPIHLGHLLVATHIKEAVQLDEIWFIVSPLNPFKQNVELADEQHRLEMVKLAVETVDYFKVSDIEFHLEKPSYTHITLKELSRKFPANNFHLIIGEDNVAEFHKWKEADWILNNYDVLVYNRTIEEKNIKSLPKFGNSNLKFYNLPMFDISSTDIRNRVKNNQSIHFFVTKNVEQYITFHKLYYKK